jgi:hypothetical protein
VSSEVLTTTSAPVVLVSRTSLSRIVSLLLMTVWLLIRLRPYHLGWHGTWRLAGCNQVEVNEREIQVLIDSCRWVRSAINTILLVTNIE